MSVVSFSPSEAPTLCAKSALLVVMVPAVPVAWNGATIPATAPMVKMASSPRPSVPAGAKRAARRSRRRSA